jgi:hypothetical protein
LPFIFFTLRKEEYILYGNNFAEIMLVAFSFWKVKSQKPLQAEGL